jgi:hypothetical protein
MYFILNTFTSNKTKNIIILHKPVLEVVEIGFVDADRKPNSIQVSVKI